MHGIGHRLLCVIGVRKSVERDIKEQEPASLTILVASGDGPSLFGVNWLNSIWLNWEEIKKIHCGFDDLIVK